jgi:YgiT-type zinc finger domain-containing protein
MSSSRQSSPTKPKRVGRCPRCGSDRVIAVVEDVTLRIAQHRHRFERIEHERCQACGERVFGIDVSLQFDAAILKRRGRRAA